MYSKLIDLADYLDESNLDKEADHLDKLIYKHSFREDVVPGGLADEKSPEDFDKDQLAKGAAIELEHTDNESLALEIAMDHLTEDSKYYDKLELMEKEAFRKLSIMGPSPQKVKEYQQPQDTRPLHVLLDMLGLVPGAGEGADLANAALYLSEGINSTNLLLAGLSVTSMVPGLGDVSKIIKYGSNLAPQTTKEIARLILTHKDKIRFVFNKLKDNKVNAYLIKLIPQGGNLITYSDRMFEAMRKWAFDIVDSGIKSEVGKTIENKQSPELDQSLISQL